MKSKKQNIEITYGNLNDKLLAIVHPSNQEPLTLKWKNENLYGKICLRNSTVNIVSMLLEDFLLNTKKYFQYSGFFGLRTRAERIYGIKIDPLKFKARTYVISQLQEIYPGLIKVPFTEQIGYVAEEQARLSLGSYLPYGFEQKAQKLAKSN